MQQARGENMGNMIIKLTFLHPENKKGLPIYQ